MALPLPYRPPKVVQLIEEQEKEEQHVELKVTIRKPDIFLSALTEWYIKLSKRDKRSLTKKRLIRRALVEAYQLRLKYESLPKGWIKTLQISCGLQLYIKKSSLDKRDRKKKELKSRKTAATSGTELQGTEQEICDEAEVQNAGASASAKTVAGISASKFKKFVDLTDQPPPKEWIKAMKNGMIPPRIQALHSTLDTNYLYWDYNMAHWQPEKSTDQPPAKMIMYEHEGNQFDWFKKQTLEEDEKQKRLAQVHGLSVRELWSLIQDKVRDDAQEKRTSRQNRNQPGKLGES